ncbi:acyl carrier protein [Paenibacillus alvei]
MGFMKAEIATIFSQGPVKMDEAVNFNKIEVSSVQAHKIVNKHRRKLEIHIHPFAFFDYKMISEFAAHFSECVEEKVAL